MRTATLLFTFNRPNYTQMVLNGLRRNTCRTDHLFMFQDGRSSNTDEKEWNAVNNIITTVDWCPCSVIVSEENRGLSRSIINGINLVTEEYDAIIVLEDDCVPHPLLVEYMIGALQRYQSEPLVFCINGYSGFDTIDVDIEDTYFSGRISSWGWATWKDRWRLFEEDYKILNRIKKDRRILEWFHIWGEDLENHLYGNIDGRCDSWAVFWALKAIEKKLLCLNPSKSLINNVGTDGTGRHKVIADNINPSLRDTSDIKSIQFPKDLTIREDVIIEATNRFSFTPETERLTYYNHFLYRYINLLRKGLFLHDSLADRKITELYVWGGGQYFDLIEKDLRNDIVIRGIIESTPYRNEYNGYKVIGCSQIERGSNIVVIPGYDMKRIRMLVQDKDLGQLVDLMELTEYKG